MIIEHSFAELKAAFEHDFPSKEFFQGRLFNYHKLFQHASSYCALNDRRKLVSTTIDHDRFIELKYLIKHLLRKRASVTLRKVVVFDDHRTVTTVDGLKSYYLDRILRCLKSEDVSIVRSSNRESILNADLDHAELLSYSNHRLLRKELEVLYDLKAVLAAFKQRLPKTNGALYHYVASSFTVFFSDFHRYYHVFRGQKTRTVLFTCHYHNEGMIAAARMHGIRLVELQHGLINTEDLYYVYKERIAVRSEDALFPDKIVVFGDYWKRLLLKGKEFRDDQIEVVGDYSLRAEGRKRFSAVQKENALLVATQKNCGHLYIPYIQRLKSLIETRYPEWSLWVKLHPHEKAPQDYSPIVNGPHCVLFKEGTDIMELIASCRIQVSIYSTTLYDAIGLGVINLSLQNYGNLADYARTMVVEGVALPVEVHDDPIAAASALEGHQLLREEDVYAEFNEVALREIFAFEG